MKPHLPLNPVNDAQMDAALSVEQDQILPSSGFADAVMTVVQAEAAAPAPIPFPWKRAIPGMVGLAAGLAILVTLVAALVSAFFRGGPASVSGHPGNPWKLDLAPFVHFVTGYDVAWMALALAIPLVCLLALRRLIFTR
jgi:hypothetical protein